MGHSRRPDLRGEFHDGRVVDFAEGGNAMKLTAVELRAVIFAVTRAIMVSPRSRRRLVPALERALDKLKNM